MTKIKLTAILMLFAALAFTACSGGSDNGGDVVVTIAAISGVTLPANGQTPVTAITETAQYTGTVAWSGTPVTFAGSTVYTATITLAAKTGFTLTGVVANFFTVAGATTDTNAADSGVVTAVYPVTAPLPAGANLPYSFPSSISFNMKYVPGGTFPKRITDSGTATVTTPYWMAETEVTYELWYAVRTWATTTGGYSFAHTGVMGNSGSGSTQQPVTTINWREAMVWCNALTEYYNANNGTDTDLDCAYYTDSGYTTPIKAATDSTTITWESGVGVNDGKEDDPYVKSLRADFF